jgi:hypothetical protein
MKPKGISIKKIIQKAILVAVVLFILLAGRIWLNYIGFCFEKRLFLSDEEKISIAIRDTLSSYPPVVLEYVEKDGRLFRTGGHIPANPIYYKDVDEFISENPDCCKVTQKMERTGYPIRLEYRLLGRANTFVEIKYKVKYIDANGIERSQMTTEYIAISNCGHPWSGI